MILKNIVIFIAFCAISSCAISFPNRHENKDKPKTNIQRIKECIDDFMTQQGVSIDDAFDVCQKIHRR